MTPIVLSLCRRRRLFRRMPLDSQSIVEYRISWKICSSKIGPSRRTIRFITVDANQSSARSPTTNKSTRCTRSPASWVCMADWRSSSNGSAHGSSICWWRHLDAARSVLHRCNRVCMVISPWFILTLKRTFSSRCEMLDFMLLCSVFLASCFEYNSKLYVVCEIFSVDDHDLENALNADWFATLPSSVGSEQRNHDVAWQCASVFLCFSSCLRFVW